MNTVGEPVLAEVHLPPAQAAVLENLANLPRNASLAIGVCKAGSATDRNKSSSGKAARVSAHKALGGEPEARAARWKRAVLAVAVAITTAAATCARSQSSRIATARKHAPPPPPLPPPPPPPPLCVARDRATTDASPAAAEVQRRRQAPRAVARAGGLRRRCAWLASATAKTPRCGGAVISELSDIAATASKRCGERVKESGARGGTCGL